VKNGKPQTMPFYSKLEINPLESWTESVQIPLLPDTRKNGSLSIFAAIAPSNDKNNRKLISTTFVTLTTYKKVSNERRLLLSSEESKVPLYDPKVPVTHWKTKVKFRYITESRSFARTQLVPDVPWDLVEDKFYRPIIYADELDLFEYHVVPLSTNESMEDPNVTLDFVPTSLGSYRLLRQLEASINLIGMDQADKEQILMLISPDKIYRFALMMVISIIHSIFAFLAFKNDVRFWSTKKTTTGISQSTVIRFLQLIEFYLPSIEF